jgi:hypothetical protein
VIGACSPGVWRIRLSGFSLTVPGEPEAARPTVPRPSLASGRRALGRSSGRDLWANLSLTGEGMRAPGVGVRTRQGASMARTRNPVPLAKRPGSTPSQTESALAVILSRRAGTAYSIACICYQLSMPARWRGGALPVKVAYIRSSPRMVRCLLKKPAS